MPAPGTRARPSSTRPPPCPLWSDSLAPGAHPLARLPRSLTSLSRHARPGGETDLILRRVPARTARPACRPAASRTRRPVDPPHRRPAVLSHRRAIGPSHRRVVAPPAPCCIAGRFRVVVPSRCRAVALSRARAVARRPVARRAVGPPRRRAPHCRPVAPPSDLVLSAAFAVLGKRWTGVILGVLAARAIAPSHAAAPGAARRPVPRCRTAESPRRRNRRAVAITALPRRVVDPPPPHRRVCRPAALSTRRSVAPPLRRSVAPPLRRSVAPPLRRSVAPSHRRPAASSTVDPSTRRPVAPSTRRPVAPSPRRPVAPSPRRIVAPSPRCRRSVAPSPRRPSTRRATASRTAAQPHSRTAVGGFPLSARSATARGSLGWLTRRSSPLRVTARSEHPAKTATSACRTPGDLHHVASRHTVDPNM
jgi:hypothetical protein